MEVTLGESERLRTVQYQNRLAEAMWHAEYQSKFNRSFRFRRNSYVCYELLGCFSRYPIGELPENPKKIPPQFRLYTNVSSYRI